MKNEINLCSYFRCKEADTAEVRKHKLEYTIQHFVEKEIKVTRNLINNYEQPHLCQKCIPITTLHKNYKINF